MKPLIQVQAVSQRFSTASGEFLALQNVSLISMRAKPSA
jgi:nitrate/nitrite transport system ATP-binding protein